VSYQVTLNSRNVLVPVTLEGRDGARLNEAPSRLDTATAMVIAVSAQGAFSQDFIPLRILSGAQSAYAGQEWELRAQPAGREHWVFYLGIPDRCFAAGPDGVEPKSLSIQVVGSSPMTGREDYSGGVDVSLQAQVAPPVMPGFLNLAERFLPALLPHSFVEAYAVDVLEAAGRRDLVLMASLQADPSADRVPVSFGKHWDPRNWIGAVVENLIPEGAAPSSYHVVRGGCFYGRNRKVTHWFGSGIGLEDPGFRQEASERIRALGPSGQGAWVFWLEPQGPAAPPPESLAGLHARLPQARFNIRHPVMHRLLGRRIPESAARAAAQAATRGAASAAPSIGRLPAESAVSALADVARILADHQAELHRARTEPSHAAWSERAAESTAVAVAATLAAAEGGPGAVKAEARPTALESAVRGLYKAQGEALRILESAFDETGGYAAWDAPGNPLREALTAYLSEGAEARSTA
jgi:hypothetical protein